MAAPHLLAGGHRMHLVGSRARLACFVLCWWLADGVGAGGAPPGGTLPRFAYVVVMDVATPTSPGIGTPEAPATPRVLTQARVLFASLRDTGTFPA